VKDLDRTKPTLIPVGGAAIQVDADAWASRVIRIAAALVTDDAGRVLLVRKRGTVAFMLPGGKIGVGEQPHATLAREVAEELRGEVDPASVRFIGCFSAPAANEPGCTVEAAIYRAALVGKVSPAAEIEEIAWVDPTHPGDIHLAPLARYHALPLAKAKATS